MEIGAIMGLLDFPYDADRTAERQNYNRLAQIFTDRQDSVMSQPQGEPWRPDHERIGGHALQAPIISPDDLIGTGIPSKLAGLLMAGAKGSMATGLLGAGMIKNQFGRIPETGKEIHSLASVLERAGVKSGHDVSVSTSGVSPSTYVTFARDGAPSQQVRLSNHKDFYPEMAPTGELSGRFSVDENSGNTFEQAVNWLKEKGYPTALSTRYQSIPTFEAAAAAEQAKRALNNNLLARQMAWLNQPKATRGPRPTE